jgi:hypothetical protein
LRDSTPLNVRKVLAGRGQSAQTVQLAVEMVDIARTMLSPQATSLWAALVLAGVRIPKVITKEKLTDDEMLKRQVCYNI